MGCSIARHRILCCTLSFDYLNHLLFEHTSGPAVTKAERAGTSNVQAKSSTGIDNLVNILDSWETWSVFYARRC